ncbi:hypothetical protein [Clostridium saudiense]|nr:hypothetical protein [Clostridium saudiense]
MSPLKKGAIYVAISIIFLIISVRIYEKINNSDINIKKFTAFYAVPG